MMMDDQNVFADQSHDDQLATTKNGSRKTILSGVGNVSYEMDVNPIVMTYAPDPLDDSPVPKLKQQEQYVEEEKRKRRERLQALLKQCGVDANREQKHQLNLTRQVHDAPLLKAMLMGKDPKQVVKQVNAKTDQKQQEQQKQLIRTDIEKQVTGNDSNTRIQARDDQVDNVVNDVEQTGSVGSQGIVAQDVISSKNTENVSDKVTDSISETLSGGESGKTIVGQDDQVLSSQSLNDPADLINNLQLDFEVVNAEQSVKNVDDQMIPWLIWVYDWARCLSRLKIRTVLMLIYQKKILR